MEKTLSAYTIPCTQQWAMHAADGKREYCISLYIPKEDAPEEGYPVIYLLDANALFGSVVEAVRLQMDKPAVVVGIGYPTEAAYYMENGAYDYTVSVPNSDWQETGGADAFLHFLEHQVMPGVTEKVLINMEKSALFGHSLAGFFTLYVLFNRPDLFGTYIAGSPAICWKDNLLITLEDQLLRMFQEWEESGNLQFKSLLLGVGAAEDMSVIEAVRDMHTRMSKWQLSNFETDLRIFLEEGHISVLHPLISRGLAHFLE